MTTGILGMRKGKPLEMKMRRNTGIIPFTDLP